ncbi:ABC transporter permease, partial [Mesorhizobium sp. M7A.F.Ca.US.003.02.1.1]
MTAISPTANQAAVRDASIAVAEARARARLRRRHALVISLRLAILVVFLGLWELGADYN